MYLFYKNPAKASYSLRGPNRPGCLLLAEGVAEALFFETWLSQTHRNPDDIAVVCLKGLDNLDIVIANHSNEENFPAVSRFGFFLDAETKHASQRARLVVGVLTKHNIIPAGHVLAPGSLLTVNGKRIALFISPNNSDEGYIEHTVMDEIRTTTLSGCIDAFGQCVAEDTGEPANPKSLVQAYIGTRRPGLCGTGRGFESGVLNVMHNAYDSVRTTIEQIL